MHKAGIDTAKLLEKARRLYLTKKEGIADSEMAKILGVSHRTANRYRIQLGGIETFQNSAKYILTPTEEELEFAKSMVQRAGFRIEEMPYKGKKELEKQLRKEELELREEMITDDY